VLKIKDDEELSYS